MKKKVLIASIILSSLVAVSASTAFAVALANKPKNSGRLIELNDLSIINSLGVGSSEGDIMHTPSLDEVYRDFVDLPDKTGFIYETDLHLNDNYFCYYLSKKTIDKIDKINEEEKLGYMSDFLGNINYLRYFKKLLNENRLSKSDKIMFESVDANETSIDRYVNGFTLVNIGRTVDISNKEIGNYFATSINYSVEDKVVHPNKNIILDKIHDNKALIHNVHYLKKFFKSGVYSVSFLDIFGYLVEENNTFSTYIGYDRYNLEKDEHYYDEIKNIVLDEQFIDQRTYTDSDDNEHRVDWYTVQCDYTKTKELFGII